VVVTLASTYRRGESLFALPAPKKKQEIGNDLEKEYQHKTTLTYSRREGIDSEF
jgi:hypothetical protein